MEDSTEVADFSFHSCRKFRLFDAKNTEAFDKEFNGNRLAVSSQCGVTLAVVSKNKIITFPTKSIVAAKISRENLNTEVRDMQVKTLEFTSVETINDIGINCDGTVLAMLHTTKNNVFIDFFFVKAICSGSGNPQNFTRVRVGTDNVNVGCALEWNPAFSDTIAATSSDRSVLVMKLDMTDPSKQSVIGAKKMGAVGTVISWSPKGKQLTIGDSVGKIIQLKPELEIVRSTLPPDRKPEYSRVTGLCWLATTEWIVSFAHDSDGNEHDTYLMKCKKDKPTEWVLLNDLSYSTGSCPLRARLLTSTDLLVDWNVVIAGNRKLSQIIPVGKLTNDWQTWTVDEGKEIYLPVSSSRADTFPIGLAIDRSMNEEIIMGFDPDSKRHNASPLVICLTSDGVLTAHHVISRISSHKSVQIPTESIQFVGLASNQNHSSNTEQLQTPKKVENSLKKVENSPNPPAVLNNLTQPLATNSPLPQKNTLLEAKTPIETPKIFSKNEDVSQKTNTKTGEEKKKLLLHMEKLSVLRQESRDELGKLTFGVQNTKRAVFECSDVVKSSFEESKDLVENLKSFIRSIEEMSEKVKKNLKEADFEVEEKLECLDELGDAEHMIEKLRDSYESEKLMKFNKLETSIDDLNNKFVECNETLKKIRIKFAENESMSKKTVLSPLRNELNKMGSWKEMEMALKVMRNISKIVMDTKEKLHRNELEVSIMKKNDGKRDVNNSISIAREEDHIPVLQFGDINGKGRKEKLSADGIAAARSSLISFLRKKGEVSTKTVKVQRYDVATSSKVEKPRDCLDTTSLKDAILHFKETPRRIMTSSIFSACSSPSTKCDATTQASEPPIIEKVIVTVESPVVTTIPPKPVTVTASRLDTTISTSTSPLVHQKLEGNLNSKKEVVVSKPEPGNLLGKSLFGVKKEEPIAEKIPEEPKETLKERVEIKNEEAPKSDTIDMDKSKIDVKEEVVTSKNSPEKKESSFSFANPQTPQKENKTEVSTPSTTSSLFGGGIKSTPVANNSPSSFGNFGQKPVEQKNETTKTENSKSPSQVSFSFASAASKPVSSENKNAFGGFATSTPTNKPLGFAASAAAAASQANNEEGMDDDTMNTGNGPSFAGSGGFMSGLGNSTATNNTSSNIFENKMNSSGSSSNSWLFGGKSNQQSTPTSFSFSNAAAQQAQKSPAQTSSVFGGAPKFGGGPSFGAKPFGGAGSGGGALSKNSSIFGADGGFAQFASNSGSSVFGGGTAANQGGSSIFGGSAKPSGSSGQSIFGGGTSNKPSTFNTWR